MSGPCTVRQCSWNCAGVRPFLRRNRHVSLTMWPPRTLGRPGRCGRSESPVPSRHSRRSPEGSRPGRNSAATSVSGRACQGVTQADTATGPIGSPSPPPAGRAGVLTQIGAVPELPDPPDPLVPVRLDVRLDVRLVTAPVSGVVTAANPEFGAGMELAMPVTV